LNKHGRLRHGLVNAFRFFDSFR